MIGIGFIGPAHIEAIRRLGHEVLAVAAATQKSAEQAADRLLVPKSYGDWLDLIKDPEIDIVHIASPNYLHFEQATKALEAGKHVVCEKPLAMTSDQTIKMIRLAEDKQLVNAVTFNIRFYPLVQEAKARLENGDLGERIYIIHGRYLQDWLLLDSDWNWRLEPELGGELRAVADIGSHWMDLVTFITGTRIKSVFADYKTFLSTRRKPQKRIDTFAGKLAVDVEYEEKPIHTEDYATVLIKFENSARGVMTVSQVSSGRKNHLFFEINGSKSSLIWDSEVPNQLIIGHRTEPNQLLIKDPSLMMESAQWTASYPGGHAEGYPDTFKQFLTAVYRYIANGDFKKKPDFPTFIDGHHQILVNEAILKSAKKNRWVDVEYRY